jgi:hypothetical protein
MTKEKLITVGVMVLLSLWNTDQVRTSRWVKDHNWCLPTALMWINQADRYAPGWMAKW